MALHWETVPCQTPIPALDVVAELVELAVGRLEAETALGSPSPRGGELGVVRPPGTRRRPAGHLVDQALRDDQQAAEHHRRPMRSTMVSYVVSGVPRQFAVM